MSGIVNYTYWRWESALSPKLCNLLLDEIDWATAESGKVEQTNIEADPTVRVSDVVFQHFMYPLGCITRMYIDVANNSAEWNFDITGQQDTQITKYKGDNKGHYDWHIDPFPPQNGIQRKLSCVILLNDPSEFEGGILQFKGMENVNVLDKQGTVVVFPSFVEHRVTPVTKGVRYTAVTWALGPAFR